MIGTNTKAFIDADGIVHEGRRFVPVVTGCGKSVEITETEAPVNCLGCLANTDASVFFSVSECITANSMKDLSLLEDDRILKGLK